MFFELKLAWKYFRTGRSRLVRFTSLAAVIGIAVGVAGFIVAQGLSRGFSDGIGGRVAEHTGHITVTPDGTVTAGKAIVTARISEVEGVDRVVPTTFEAAAFVTGDEKRYAVLRVVPDDSPGFGAAESDKPAGEPGIPVLAGGRLMRDQVSVPTTAELVLSTGRETAGWRTVRVAGTFTTGLYEYDSTWLRVRESDYMKLKGQVEFEPGIYSVYVDDPFSVDAVASIIAERLGPGFEVIDWREANRPLFSALVLERRVALIVIAIIVLIAAMNITTTLSLLVHERLPDIAVLRTCGATTRALAAVFLLEGWILSLAGIAGGSAAGMLFTAAANRLELISIPAEVYSLSSVTVILSPGDVILAACGAFLLCTAAMAVPIVHATRSRPLDNLRLK